ncbi:putative Gdt1 family protein [Helianthus debilis subsp. tardiflorus]
MRHPRRHVLAGCLSSLIVMTLLSAAVGMAAPNLISQTLTKHITTVLFFGFGLWSLWDAYNDDDSEELAEVEAELDADIKSNEGTTKSNNKLATIGLAAAENPMGVVIGGIIGQALCQTAAVFGGKSLATQISERFVRDVYDFVRLVSIFFKRLNKMFINLIQIALSGGILFIIFGIQSFFSTIES